jgi:dsDNA-specific endonuclease/ATPase MutS2
MKVLVTAQEIQSAIYDQGVTDENIIELDIEALRPLYNQFVEEVEECLKYFNDDDQLAKEGYYGISSIYTSALKDTKVSLSELFKRVEEQRPLSEVDWMSHEAIPRTGTIREFESELSDLIDEYNRL